MQPEVRGKRFDEFGEDFLGRREIGRRLVSRVRSLLPGENLPLTLVRNGEKIEVAVEIEAASDQRQLIIDFERVFGLRLAEAGEDHEGVLIAGIAPDSRVARIRGSDRLIGMKIVQVAGITVGSLDDLSAVMPDIEALMRSGRQRQLAVTFEDEAGKQFQVPGFPLSSG